MGSGITYNSRVSYRIFLLCEKKALRVCEQKYRRHICHVFFLLGDQSIFIARGRGGFRCFFFLFLLEEGHVVSIGNGVDISRR